jgi:cytoskeletal protein CcmA (bactofilin family)
MKKLCFLLFSICLSTSLLAQKNVTITGYIFDNTTNLTLPYVNIGFVEKAVGTVSDEDGKFWLTYNTHKISSDDILQISSIGYKTIKIKASKFYGTITKSNTIYLTPMPYALDEVVISNEERRIKRVGSSKKKEYSIGYWLNKEALGGEIATKINITHKNSKLHNLKFYVVKNNSGSIKVRINIYRYNNGTPGENILKTNIYHTISKPFGEEEIDLEPYNIVVHDNIVVSIELVKVFGTYIDFEFAASRFKGISFTRHLSQDKWKKYDNLMAFSLKTSYPIKRKTDKVIARTFPKKITLYWDTSLSMKNRNLKRETDLIKRYLKKLKNTSVEVIKFSTNPQEPKLFLVKNGNTEALVNYLESSNYDGATNYAKILKENVFEAETILVFTDGDENFEPLKQLVYVPTFYINSLASANHVKLQEEASYADGYYINLLKTDSKTGLELLLKEVEDEETYVVKLLKRDGNIYGTIKSDSLLIYGATIRVKNTLREVTPDTNGNYRINAKVGDILIINAFGMLEKQVQISDNNKIDIELKPDGELLDEVLLEGKSKKEERIVETPYGKKSFDAVTFAVDGITNKDISSSHQTLDQVIAKLPGVIISGIGSNKRYSLPRRMGSSFLQDTNPIIIIDDITYFQEDGLDNLPPIDMQLVESVQVLKSLASTNKYGSAGAYGAIVIKTQATSFNWIKVEKKKPSALITGNNYEEDNPLINANQTKPNYISKLENAVSYKNALAIYKQQRTPLSIPYYINVSDYFQRWDKDYALNILSNIAVIAKINPKALRTLAYKFEENNKLEEARYIYERIAILRPKEAQSYRDLALIYQQTGAYKKAMKLYGQMLNNTIEGVDFSGLQQPIVSELKHLLSLHRSKVDITGIAPEFSNANFKYDLRIIFDWNDPNTEFEVQFVNPQKKYFKWSQTKLENRERMIDGITKGYHTEEFIIDDDEDGEWLINIETLNKEAKRNPTYLKYTVYKNYGLASETKVVKVINLNDCNPKITFDRLKYQ